MQYNTTQYDTMQCNTIPLSYIIVILIVILLIFNGDVCFFGDDLLNTFIFASIKQLHTVNARYKYLSRIN